MYGPIVLVVDVPGRTAMLTTACASGEQDQGLEILAFPCNQFGGQEPGSDADVKRFAEGYGAKFPIFSKIDVNGPGMAAALPRPKRRWFMMTVAALWCAGRSGTHPFYASLKSTAGGGILGNDIKWNFGKFVIDRQGNVKRYAPTSSPLSMEDDIKKLL
eukprot:scaffold2944_cov302-Prasinococcus_capsulatus_cf.AAC.3